MSRATRLDPELWDRIKRRYERSSQVGGSGWNARKAQHSNLPDSKMLEYKRKGGRYSKRTPQSETSLHKWTAENWKYIDGDKTGRYLPEKVIRNLSDKEKLRENRKKRNAKTKRESYSTSVAEKMRRQHVF